MGVLIRLDGIIISCCFKLVYPFIPVCRVPENYRDNKRCHDPAKDNPPHNSTSWGKTVLPHRIRRCAPQQAVTNTTPFLPFLWLFLPFGHLSEKTPYHCWPRQPEGKR